MLSLRTELVSCLYYVTRCLKITKSLIQHCERSELRLHFEWTKVNQFATVASFWRPEACGQTVLPDRSILIGQKMMRNAKIENFKCNILSNFQTIWATWDHVDSIHIHFFQCNNGSLIRGRTNKKIWLMQATGRKSDEAKVESFLSTGANRDWVLWLSRRVV